MPTRVKLPDGRYVTVSTDDPQKAAAAAKKYYAANPTRPAQPRRASAARPAAPRRAAPRRTLTPFGVARSFLEDTVDNLLPNMGDEIAGFGGGLRSLVTEGDYMSGFKKGQREFKERNEVYERDHRALDAASTGTGTLAGMLLPAGRVAQGAGLGARTAQAGAVGFGYGAMSGLGQGEGLEERLTNAGREGLTGGAVGMVIPGGSQAAQNAGRWARRNVPGVDAAYRAATAIPSRILRSVTGQPARAAGVEQADRLIGEQMRRGNIQNGFGQPGVPASPQAIADEVAQRNARGVPAMIGDTTEEMRGLTEYASRGIGPGQSLVRRALEGRKATEGQRVRQHVQDTFPTTDDPIRFVEEAGQRARRDAEPLYRQAYAQPMFRNEAIQGIEQTPAFREALPQAFRNIRNQIDEATGLPKNPNAMGFREMRDVDPNGLPPNGPYFQAEDGRWISFENGLSTEGYDQVIRAMRDSGRSAANVNPVTGRIENTTNSVHINARAADLRNQLASQNAPFREATERYADEMGIRQAFDQGGNVGTATGHEINAQLRTIPQNARDAFTRGAGTAMADEASRYASRFPSGDAANRVRQMIGDDVKQQALSEAQGNTGGVRDLLERLEYEQQGNQVYRRVNGNSATAQRQQLDADLDSGAGIPTSRDGIVSRIITALADRAAPQLKQDLKERIAQVVTASDAQTVQEVMEAIAAQAERDAQFRRLLQQASVGAAAAYGSNLQAE